MTAESKTGMKQVLMSVAASLVVASVINVLAFTSSFSRMSVIVEQLALRVDAIEEDYEQHKKDTGLLLQELQLSLVRIQEGLTVIRDDVRDITIDHKAMMRDDDGNETVTRKEYTRKRKSQ